MAQELIIETESAFDTQVPLYPLSLAEFEGQINVKKQIGLALQSASAKNIPLDHVIAIGPPGLGKSAITRIITAGTPSAVLYCGTVRASKELALGILQARMEGATRIVLEEIHSLSSHAMESLHMLLDENKLQIRESGHLQTFSVGGCTIVATTTNPAKLSVPLMQRFGIPLLFTHYNQEDLGRIISRSANLLDTEISPDAALTIGRVSRGLPRIANRLLRRVRDYTDELTPQSVREALMFWGVDELGLTDVDREYLRALAEFGSNPVGASTLSTILGTNQKTLVEFYEPFLIRDKLIMITPKGRVLTQKGIQAANYKGS